MNLFRKRLSFLMGLSSGTVNDSGYIGIVFLLVLLLQKFLQQFLQELTLPILLKLCGLKPRNSGPEKMCPCIANKS